MARSTRVSGAWLPFAGVLFLCSLPGVALPASGDGAPLVEVDVRTQAQAACSAAPQESDVVVCPWRSTPPALNPSPCLSNSWVPQCPLQTPHVLAAQDGLAKASLVVAFQEYSELTNAKYQALTPQIDAGATTEKDCDRAKGKWVSGQCLVLPRVRVEPKTLAEDTCTWCCSTHRDAIWKGQSEGPNAGCMVPSYVYHRGLLADENLAIGDTLLDRPAKLRSYGFIEGELPAACQSDPTQCGKLDFGFPGWTILLRKGSPPTAPTPTTPTGPLPNNGDRLELSLWNLLPPDDIRDDSCNPQNQPDPGDVYPACFHGNDVTNVHFHGSHVSPQTHQDNVLVNVKPLGTYDRTGHGDIFYGRYDIALDPITWRQAEGTHWYHPHKHGSTSLQVLNGMAGPLIIKGKFDDFIEESAFGAAPGTYQRSLAPQDKVLVVQAIADDINLSARFDRWNTPWTMVNGQFQPVIRMQPGEVQRWRLIGATQDASAHVELSLEGSGLDVEQIAQDGVQLAPENYPQVWQPDDDELWQLAPGNRIDLLVRASTDPSMAGKRLTMMQQPSSKLPNLVRQRRFIGDSKAVFPLFFVEICHPQRDSSCTVQTKMQIPDELRDLPDYLRKIEDGEISRRRTITFDQTADPAGASRDGAAAPKAVAKFRIDRQPYDMDCFNQTMQVGTAEEWRIVNNTVMNHPLHIHVNPFQVTWTKYARPLDPPQGPYTNLYEIVDHPFDSPSWKAPVWRDTIALPTMQALGCIDKTSGDPVPQIVDSQTCLDQGFLPPRRADDRSLLPIGPMPGEITLRQRFEDFTGPYVLHCHILGHEDRGMMQNLQTVCPSAKPGEPGPYATPANYFLDDKGNFVPPHQIPEVRARECSKPSYLPAGSACKPSPSP